MTVVIGTPNIELREAPGTVVRVRVPLAKDLRAGGDLLGGVCGSDDAPAGPATLVAADDGGADRAARAVDEAEVFMLRGLGPVEFELLLHVRLYFFTRTGVN
jgi:hypothetical protein